jgi:uncharacterized protein
MSGKIFINYRRGAESGVTQALFARLEQSFPSETLFMDVDNIPPGRDFVHEIELQVERCDVLLAVIGKGWLAATDEAGRRRLDDPNDLVRVEIQSALQHGKEVIPVLVNEGRMPRAEELPEALKPLARRNAVRLSHERLKADTQGLVKALNLSFQKLRRSNIAEAAPVHTEWHGTKEPHVLSTRYEEEVRVRGQQHFDVHQELGAAAFGTSQARPPSLYEGNLLRYVPLTYNYLSASVCLSGVVAYVLFEQAFTTDPALAAHAASGAAYALKRGMYLTPFGLAIFASPLKWVVMLAPLAFVFFLSFRVYKMSLAAAQITFWLFAAVMGLSLSSIFLVFTGQSITQVFLVTAIAFGGLSLYGYTTKKDPSGWGSFLIMGVIGIIAAGVVNLFLQSTALQFATSVIGVLVFTGLASNSIHRVKNSQEFSIYALESKPAVVVALSVYLGLFKIFG